MTVHHFYLYIELLHYDTYIIAMAIVIIYSQYTKLIVILNVMVTT